MNEQEVRQLLVETKAILEGHFLLTSGLHSPLYVEKFNVLQQPRYTEALCKELAARFADQKVDTVLGPMTGGILLAHEVGKALGTRAIFTERENGKMTLRRGFKPLCGKPLRSQGLFLLQRFVFAVTIGLRRDKRGLVQGNGADYGTTKKRTASRGPKSSEGIAYATPPRFFPVGGIAVYRRRLRGVVVFRHA